MKSVSGKELCRILESNGEFALLTVPVHGNTALKTGLLASILKSASLTEENLL